MNVDLGTGTSVAGVMWIQLLLFVESCPNKMLLLFLPPPT